MGLKQRVEMVQHAWNRGIKLILCFMVMGKSLMGIRCQSSSVDQTLDQILGGNNWNFQLGSFLHTIAWGGLVPNDDIHRIDGFSFETWMVSNEWERCCRLLVAVPVEVGRLSTMEASPASNTCLQVSNNRFLFGAKWIFICLNRFALFFNMALCKKVNLVNNLHPEWLPVGQ